MTTGPYRVLVIGSGWRFTSGISYYTCRLTNALATVTPTRALLMRRLVPRMLYPGRRRVGDVVNAMAYDPAVDVLDGVDWYWGRSAMRARRFIERDHPDIVILQWWTGAVLHSYLLLITLARRRGAKVIMEWHEVQDTGEARIPGVERYVRGAMRLLMRRIDAHVVHSQYDLDLLQSAYGLDPRQVTIIPHGPYDHLAGPEPAELAETAAAAETDQMAETAAAAETDQMAETAAAAETDQMAATATPVAATPATAVAANDVALQPFRLLFFGVIRPYKGVEDLIDAFTQLDQESGPGFHLTVVGETWEGWHQPLDAIAASPARERITVVNRYVPDAEAAAHFAAADAVVLPYHRSSSSGPLHVAMSTGLPVVVTAVGGLVEAAKNYSGVVFVPPRDPAALAEALRTLPALRGQRFPDPHSWHASVEAYLGVFARIADPRSMIKVRSGAA